MKRIISALIFSLLTSLAFASVPQQINYQGYLTSPSGTPLDTTVGITFKLYTDSTAGTLLWTETRSSVVVQKGLFNVKLGQGTALTDAIVNQTQLWLGTTVGADAEMTPRTRIVSVGYSYRVGTVDGATGGTISSDVNISGRINVGQSNTNSGTRSVVFGGNNTVSGDYSNASGYNNTASGDYGTVGGGFRNSTGGSYATIGGGTDNSTGNPYTSICGGDSNRAYGQLSFIGGGRQNHAPSSGNYQVIGGGFQNFASDSFSSVLSGARNFARGRFNVICGGGYFDESTAADSNVTNDYFSAIVGGYSNRATGYGSFVGAGLNNRATAANSTVCAGGGNVASGYFSVIGGGNGNTANQDFTSVCGGYYNIADGGFDGCATVGGGYLNEASGSFSTVSGGRRNTADGWHATIPGGYNNTASGSHTFASGYFSSVTGNYSTAMGANVSVSADSAFAWSDGSGPTFSIGADNTFNLKANGGFRFWTTADHAANIGARLPAGGSAWVALSDSTKKRNARLVDTKTVLEKVSSIPIKQWSYESQDPSIEHIGPMAQDFWNEFHIGDDSLSISTIDPSGIALAAIQGLRTEKDRQIAKLEKEVIELRSMLQTLIADKKLIMK